MKPPNRYIPGESNNFSYDLGSSEFDEIKTLAYHCDCVVQELPKGIEEKRFPEWYRATEAEYESFQNDEVRELVELP